MNQPCAIHVTAHEQAELVPVPLPDKPLGPQEVEGRTLVSLASPGTELAGAYQADRFPRPVGYAAVAEVTRVGEEVTDLAPGDRAFFVGPHRSWQRARREDVVRVPDEVPTEQAPWCRLMGVSMTTLITTAARPGDVVVVSGLGPVGHLAAQMFAASGYRVIGCDPVESRRALLERLAGVETRPLAPVDDEALKDTVALVVECSGHEQAVLDACKLVRKRGEVVMVGVPWRPRSDLTAHALLHAVFHRYVVLRSGWEWELPRHPGHFQPHTTYGNYVTALRWLAEGRVTVDGLAELRSPADCQAAYQDLLHQRVDGLSVLFDWRGADGG